MSLTDALDRYFAAWNDHDPDAVVRSLADGGSYEDPTTGGPLTGDALAANVATLLAGFPDLHFDLVSVAPTSDTTAAAQWLMQGTNTGPMPAGPATGQTVALPGADFIDYDPAADRIAKVTGYFDTATMLRQLGLQAHITPADMEPVTKFGISLHVDTQRQTIPGAFSVTWIDIDPERQFTLFERRHWHRDGTARQRRLPRLVFCDHRAPQLHLHRLGKRRGCQGRAPQRRPRRGDAASGKRRDRR